MQANSATNPWPGRIGIGLTVLPALMLLMSAGMKLSQQPPVVEAFGHFGYPSELLVPIGVLELVSTILYLVPQTAVLGAVLLTAYLGGATATHVRLAEPFVTPVAVAMFVWLGLYLRDGRVRALLPLRR